MQDLIKQEQFELEVLDRLNSKRVLNDLIFAGGTMLRLCFGLNRFSVDLDFWIIKDTDTNKLFGDLKEYLSSYYELTDANNKFYTLLFEIRSNDYPRRLKIEIRKEIKKFKPEQAIAYSRYSNVQVFLKIAPLEVMMKSKSAAFLERKEIRDIYDIEFLLKKGVSIDISDEDMKKIIRGIDSFSKKEYSVKLGSLLDEEQRKYYVNENFKILKSAIYEKINRK